VPPHPHFDLDLRLGSSRRQRVWLVTGHALALLAVGGSGVPAPWPVVLTLTALAHGVGSCLNRDRFRGWRIRYRAGDWALDDAAGRQVASRLLPSTWLGPWLCLLHWRCDDGRFLALPVWCDSLPPADYRRLRARLRWG